MAVQPRHRSCSTEYAGHYGSGRVWLFHPLRLLLPQHVCLRLVFGPGDEGQYFPPTLMYRTTRSLTLQRACLSRKWTISSALQNSSSSSKTRRRPKASARAKTIHVMWRACPPRWKLPLLLLLLRDPNLNNTLDLLIRSGASAKRMIENGSQDKSQKQALQAMLCVK